MSPSPNAPRSYGQCRLSKPRPFMAREIEIIEHLLKVSGLREKFEFPGRYWAQDYLGVGNNNILIVHETNISKDRRPGVQLGDLEFRDSDDILVQTSLDLDQGGLIFDLDVWKVNDEQIIHWPSVNEMEYIPR